MYSSMHLKESESSQGEQLHTLLSSEVEPPMLIHNVKNIVSAPSHPSHVLFTSRWRRVIIINRRAIDPVTLLSGWVNTFEHTSVIL